MPRTPHVRIINSTGVGLDTKVFIDGLDVSRFLDEVRVVAGVNEVLHVELRVPLASVEIDNGAGDHPTLRPGRKAGRTLYRQHGAQPSDDDELIGVMDTADWARLVAEAVNAHHGSG